MKTGIVGDLHLKENLGYADYIWDRRASEKREVFDFIVGELADCENIVLLGDSLNGRNNPSQVIKEFVALLKRFKDKQIYILAGNHEKQADGRSAIDFIKELKIKNWHVITDKIVEIDDMVFCPYFTRHEFKLRTEKEATARLLKDLSGRNKKILFVHHAINGTKVTSGLSVDLFHEIILPRKELEKEYELIFGGHIHYPTQEGKIVVAGSVFCNEVGEHEKYIWKLDSGKIEALKLPGRGIYKVENSMAELAKINNENIVKFFLTERGIYSAEQEVYNEKGEKIPSLADLKTMLSSFDGHLLLERYPSTRKKIDIKDIALDFEPEKMLEIYAKERDVDLKKLKIAYDLIK